jgi:DNA-binding XRE family transcriptional regulator
MAATKAHAPDATPVLDFDAIEARAVELEIDNLADYLGYHETTLWRWRNGLTSPNWETTRAIAAKMRMSLDEIQPKLEQNAPTQPPPTDPPPSGPPNDPPPSGPKRTVAV